MAEKIKSINLLPSKGNGIFDQFLSWALTVGRLLIILTETLALGTFLYRFSIDMKIIDLHDLIKNQRIIVEQFKNTEETARSLHTRLALANEYDSTGSVAPNTFSDIIEMGRGKITFRNLIVSGNSVKIEAQASGSNALNEFVNLLKEYPAVKSVSIDSIENKTSNATIFMTITANLKETQEQTSQVPGPMQIPDNIQP